MLSRSRAFVGGACGMVLVLSLSHVPTARSEDLVARALAKDTHPLQAALRWAVDQHERVRKEVRDYTCLLVKRERVDGELGEREFMFAKVRHRRQDGNGNTTPFGVYLKFYSPDSVKNREVLFVEGKNEGKIVARRGGDRFAFITTTLDPNSDLAMRGNRYPITEIGFENLIKRLIEVAQNEILNGRSEVRYFKGAKVDNRECIAIEVKQQEDDFDADFYLARVYIDQELMIPIHYESYGFPEEEDGEPILLEQYTYRDIRINVGLSGEDFQRDNPGYGFR